MSAQTDFSELGPVTPPAPEDSITAGDDTLARLLDRVSRQPDFPSLGQALSGVRRVARSEKARLQHLTEALMQDVGLSARVLRMANSAHYGSVGAGEIDTLERAAAVMGFVEVGRLALTARLVDSLRTSVPGQALREPFLRALLSGQMAHALAHSQAEDGTLIAVLRNLGRLVAAMHLPEEALAVQQASADVSPEAEALVARRLLGTDYHRLGQAVAERWGWPPSLRRAIGHGEDPPRHYPHSRTEQLRCMGWLANELTDVLLYLPDARHDEAVATLASRFGAATAHDGDSLAAALQRVRPAVAPLCEQLGLPAAALPRPRITAAAAAAAVPLVAPAVLPEPLPPAPPPPAAPDPLPRRVLLGLLRLTGAQRAVLCWRRGRAGELVGEQGLAEGIDPGHSHFLVPPDDDQDLFSLLCRRGADTCIDDTADPAIARYLPHWWRSRIGARSLLLLPMRHEGQVLGLLYADAPRAASLRPDEATLARLRAWRDELLQERLGYRSAP
ncbi:HDOD domain-containing protein [Ideonella sp. 4Y11]|uniref:HDOD domain-containing protein n=1 Tax=Ideonella aquatica TaxID=2824119 RepID=A0A941BSG6_9BURK|nr:HDOD domain-containing protein [Ideonella aquatica]MBQ0961650.1 HDOD domain-containing protein [Ideonella aquatica]